MAKGDEVVVDGHRLRLSNLDKVLYPAAGFTKAEVIDYYARIAPAMLPHVGHRALTFRRFPDGVDGSSFYEKNCPSHRPGWIRTVAVRGTEGTTSHCRLEDRAGLVWAANLAALELHTPMARAERPTRPTMVVFDLDPGPPAGVLQCGEVALWLREELKGLGLEAVPKTSGSKGLQVYVPLNRPARYERTTPFARELAQTLQHRRPQQVVSVQRKDLRRGKVLVDWSQNARHKTTVCAYSLRARPRPTVSTPVAWDEVEAAVDAGDPDRLVFEAPDVLRRVADQGDLFAAAAESEQELP